MDHMASADADAKTVSKIVNQDPALVAKVLQVANSAFFCRAKPVADIVTAITHVGLDTLRALVLLMEVCGNGDARSSALRETSLRAMRIAEHVAIGNREAFEGTTAALLCKIARLIPNLDDQCALADARDEGHFGYAEVGAYLLGSWGLPMAVVEAVACHAVPSIGAGGKTFGATGIAHVASMLAIGAPPDMDYLEHCGVAGKLAGWNDAATRIRGQP
jgi:HD-like signal output (HDOD) protein